jgi:ribosome biogenesis GTPase
MLGLVMKSTGSWYNVRASDAGIIKCRVRGKLKIAGMKVTNPVAVGDRVHFEMEEDGKGIIHTIEPRTNYLIRKSTRKTTYGHILASNIDLAVVVATVSFPKTSLGFIDRFLISAESFRIPSLLLFNKTDQWTSETFEFASYLETVYRKINVDFMTLSALTGQNVDILKRKLSGKTSLMAGHSGVGKSTILNLLAPNIQQKTAEVSSFANKGTHTTTFAEMFEIEPHTYVIDTPGIKELGLIDIDDEEINHFFPEMRALFGHCKFHNCTHTHEPGCAVHQAVQKGHISISRYESYLSMMEDYDSHR